MKKQPKKTQPARIWHLAAITSALLFFSLCWILLDVLFSFTGTDAPRTVEIPDFCGREEAELQIPSELDAVYEYRYDSDVPRGVVISQSPPSGSRQKLSAGQKSLRVTLFVSLGKERVEFPHVVGMDARAAGEVLRACGLTPRVRTVCVERGIGKVIACSERAGEMLFRGETVELTVGVGKQARTVRVPDLIGNTREEALLSLSLAQLSFEECIEPCTTVPDGVVLRQSHVSGTTVLAGTKITLYIARNETRRMECTEEGEGS